MEIKLDERTADEVRKDNEDDFILVESQNKKNVPFLDIQDEYYDNPTLKEFADKIVQENKAASLGIAVDIECFRLTGEKSVNLLTKYLKY